MEKSTATVHIGEKAYTVSSARGLSYVERVAQLVNVRAAEVAKAARLHNQEAVTVATLISLAEELVQAQDDNQRLRKQLTDDAHDAP